MMNDERMPEDLRSRTRRFGARVIGVCAALGDRGAAGVIGRQLVRSGTSVGAQYREGCRARSTAEFVSKLESALQELDETSYWLELLAESQIIKVSKLRPLMDECDQLTAILVASVKTAKKNKGA